MHRQAARQDRQAIAKSIKLVDRTALRLSSETGGRVEKKLKPIPTGPGQLHIQKW